MSVTLSSFHEGLYYYCTIIRAPPREAHSLVVQHITLDHSLGNVDVPLWTWVRTWAVAYDHFPERWNSVSGRSTMAGGRRSWLARGCLMTLLVLFLFLFFVTA